MNFYFVLNGCLFFLILFGVFEHLLKFYNINKWFACLFVFLSCVFNMLQSFQIFGIMINLNFVLYIFTFFVYLFKLKGFKNYFKMIFVSLIIVAVLMCYSAFDFADFEYSFVGIYVYVAIIVGFVLSFILPNLKTTFCGTMLGGVIYDLIYWKFFNGLDSEMFTLWQISTLTFVFVTICSYCISNYFVWLSKTYRNKKKQETTN